MLSSFYIFSDSVGVDFREIHYQCHAIKWALTPRPSDHELTLNQRANDSEREIMKKFLKIH